MSNYKSLLKNVTTFIFDYDGVLTDGTVILQDDGEALRTANVKDGYALQLAIKTGISCCNHFRRNIEIDVTAI